MIRNEVNRMKTDDLKPQYRSIIERSPGTSRQYLGQPDLTKTGTGRLILVYPQGHGKGPIIMRISDDHGKTWREHHALPKSWESSQETPTIYTLKMKDGKEKILLISACPGWGSDAVGHRYGFNTSISDDDGETWSEFKHWFPKIEGKDNDSIVAMSSLIHLKNDQGEYEDRWLGVYHNHAFINYRTYLSFDEEGRESWSEPEPIFFEMREEEKEKKICELGMIRSKNDDIIAFGRTQSHRHLSVMTYSKDEGKTWSNFVSLPISLAGERHKLLYDQKTETVMVTFREIIYDFDEEGYIKDWIGGDWILWVGTWQQILSLQNGYLRLRLAEDYTPSPKKGDTGYAGIAITEDRNLILHSYGHWDQEFSKEWEGDVTEDLSYIIQVKIPMYSLVEKTRHISFPKSIVHD